MPNRRQSYPTDPAILKNDGSRRKRKMRQTISQQILKQLNGLPSVEQRRVLAFARALGQTMPAGAFWDELSRIAAGIDRADLRRMTKAIERGNDRIDLNEG